MPWNDPEAVARALATRPPAAILCEPCPANMGVVPARPGFLRFLREQADRAGALLIFDEVISGFRVAPGGMQERAGVLPDLTILGKVLGGGVPAGAVAGRRDLLRSFAPSGPVYQAGTLSGNPLAVAAGLATLELLDAAAYRKLEDCTLALAAGLRDAARDAGAPLQVRSTTGLLTLFFATDPVEDWAGARAADTECYARFFRGMLDRGVYLPPSQFEAWFPSLEHDDECVRLTLDAARETLTEIFTEGGCHVR